MKTLNLNLNSVDDVKEFVNTVNKYETNVDLNSGRYVIDAKSIMGVFSLDLSKPITCTIHGDGDNTDLVNDLKKYETSASV